jgi:hypothetical protein
MKKAIPMIILLAVALMLSACGVNIHIGGNRVVTGSGEVVTRDFPVSGFDAVRLESIGELTITQGETESLSIEAEDNILDALEVQVYGDTLVLGSHFFASITPTKTIRYTLTVKDLSKLELAGLGDITMQGLETGRLDLDISGSGDLKLSDLKAENVNATISGLGSVELAGQASSLDIDLSGSGNCTAGDLSVQDVQIDISGLGDAVVWASNSLEIRISGAGGLKYYGTPRINQEISGLGSIKSLGDR